MSNLLQNEAQTDSLLLLIQRPKTETSILYHFNALHTLLEALQVDSAHLCQKHAGQKQSGQKELSWEILVLHYHLKMSNYFVTF